MYVEEPALGLSATQVANLWSSARGVILPMDHPGDWRTPEGQYPQPIPMACLEDATSIYCSLKQQGTKARFVNPLRQQLSTALRHWVGVRTGVPQHDNILVVDVTERTFKQVPMRLKEHLRWKLEQHEPSLGVSKTYLLNLLQHIITEVRRPLQVRKRKACMIGTAANSIPTAEVMLRHVESQTGSVERLQTADDSAPNQVDPVAVVSASFVANPPLSSMPHEAPQRPRQLPTQKDTSTVDVDIDVDHGEYNDSWGGDWDPSDDVQQQQDDTQPVAVIPTQSTSTVVAPRSLSHSREQVNLTYTLPPSASLNPSLVDSTVLIIGTHEVSSSQHAINLQHASPQSTAAVPTPSIIPNSHSQSPEKVLVVPTATEDVNTTTTEGVDTTTEEHPMKRQRRSQRHRACKFAGHVSVEKQWEIESILDAAWEGGIRFYKVKWCGYPFTEASWVKRDAFSPGGLDAVEAFEQKLRDTKL